MKRRTVDVAKLKKRKQHNKEWDTMRKRAGKKGSKQPTVTQRAKLKAALKKAGLTRTRPQRVSERKAFKETFGYEQPRLSIAVGTRRPDGTIKPGKASRYTVTGRKIIREPGKPVYVEAEYRHETIPMEQRTGRGSTQREILVKKGYWKTPKEKVISEELIVRRVSKGKTAKKGSSRGEGAVRLGSARSIRGMQRATRQKKKARAGGRTIREAKKKKKTKKKK